MGLVFGKLQRVNISFKLKRAQKTQNQNALVKCIQNISQEINKKSQKLFKRR